MENLRLAQYDGRGYQHSSLMKLIKSCFNMRRTDAEVVALYEDQTEQQRPDLRFSNLKVESLPSPRKPLMAENTSIFYDVEAAEPEVEALVESSAVPARIRNAHLHSVGGGLATEDIDLNLDNLRFGGGSGGQGGHPFWGQLGDLCEKLDQETQVAELVESELALAQGQSDLILSAERELSVETEPESILAARTSPRLQSKRQLFT